MIELRNVSKTFGRRPRVTALRDVTLDIMRGSVTAVVGPNGAGKSTLFGVALGFLRPTSGDIAIADDDPRSYMLDHGIGYMPDRFRIPADWPVGRAFTALSRIGQLSDDAMRSALQKFGLEDQLHKKAGSLSRGLLQRLGLAQAFAADRELLVLDEPAEGLDPVWRVKLRDEIEAQRRAGHTIVLASHDLTEVERIADTVIILDRGTVREIVSRHTRPASSTYRITLADEHHDGLLHVFPDATHHAGYAYDVEVSDVADLNLRLAALLETGSRITAVTPAVSLDAHVRKALES
jgi:ABC-2 type transport system ATP-binding protein